MMIFDSQNDLHVVIRTVHTVLLDTIASAVEVEDQLGPFTLQSGEPALAAIVPSEIVVRRRDGSEARIEVTWGSLTAVGSQVRIIVKSGEVVARTRDLGAFPIAV